MKSDRAVDVGSATSMASTAPRQWGEGRTFLHEARVKRQLPLNTWHTICETYSTPLQFRREILRTDLFC